MPIENYCLIQVPSGNRKSILHDDWSVVRDQRNENGDEQVSNIPAETKE